MIFFKYLLVSGISLTIDLIVYKLLIDSHVLNAPINASLSYLVGLTNAYILFIRDLFKNTRHSETRPIELSLFFLSGLIGVASSYFVTLIATSILGLNQWPSKAVAVLVSFLLVYKFRIKFVFASKEGVKK